MSPAHVSDIDKIVASVVKTAHDVGVINNTIIVFLALPDSSDVALERNIRRTAFIYSPLLKLQQSVFNQLIHSIDLLPTLANALNLKWQSEDTIDGINLWKTLNKNEEKRTEIYGDNFYINNSWKLSYEGDKDESHSNESLEKARGVTEIDSEAYANAVMKSDIHQIFNKLNPPTIKLLKSRAKVHCNLQEKVFNGTTCNRSNPCLFDLLEDPCELDNKFGPEFTTRRQQMQEKLEKYLKDGRAGNISSDSFAVDPNDSIEDGTMVGIVMGATIGVCIFIFILVVCVKERCNRKRSVYYDKSKAKAEKTADGPESDPNPKNFDHQNSASAISHM